MPFFCTSLCVSAIDFQHSFFQIDGMKKRHSSEEDEHQEAHTGAEFAGDAAKHSPGGTLSVSTGSNTPGNLAPAYAEGAGRARSRALAVDEYAEGILRGDRIVLARAITLIESRKPDDNRLARALLGAVLPHAGRAARVGITGVPGVGKSTFIEALGCMLTEAGQRVAVLAVDPSSRISKGSIMGDKTRMERLASDPRAFIRPSPSAGSLGGVARKTREAMLLCEAAGFDVVIVETVGVGQSETVVHSMVDFFLLLMLAGAGDQLQGIKRGIMEMADALVIHKADGDNRIAADRARGEYEQAMHFLRSVSPDWFPPVLTCSSVTLEGIGDVWRTIAQHRALMTQNGYLRARRAEQDREWMHDTIREALLDSFETHAGVAALLPQLERQVEEGSLPAVTAAQQLLDVFAGRKDGTVP